jgi:thymidylate synthase ThyX
LSSPNVASARYGHKFDKVYTTPYEELSELLRASEGQIEAYNRLLQKVADRPPEERKRIREIAAMYIPQGTIVEHDILFNLRSLRNFFDLRLAKDAQPEVREIASQMKHELSQKEEIRHALRYFIERDFDTIQS